MTTPLELARELDVRVEALMQSLAEAGGRPLDYEATLSVEDVEHLRARFAAPRRRSIFARVLDRLRRKPNREQIDRELYARAMPDVADVAAPPQAPAPASLPEVPADDALTALSAVELLDDSVPEAPAEPAVAAGVASDSGGEIDLGALLGAATEVAPTPASADEGDVDLSALLGATPQAAAEPAASPEELLGLSFEADQGEEDFDLQALLESSIVEAEPAPKPAAKTKAKARDEDLDLSQLPPAAPAPVAPATGRTAPLSPMQKIWVIAAAAIMLALAGVVGRSYWVYYQEHRPGGDQRLFAQGLGCLEAKQYDKAAERLGKLIQNYPQSPLSEQAFFKYGAALFGQGKYPAAVSTYRRALEFQERRVAATENLDYPDIAQRQEAQVQVARGLALSGNFEDAAEEYDKLLKLYRNDEIERSLKLELAELYSHWGVKRGDSEPLEMSVGLYQIVAAENPRAQATVGWYDAIGQACVALAKLEHASAEAHQRDARDAFRTALSSGAELGFNAGQEESILCELGRACEQLDDDAGTVAAYNQLLERSPDLPQQAQAYTGLSEIEMRKADLHREQALREMRRIEARIGTAAAEAVLPSQSRFPGGNEVVEEKSALLAAALTKLASDPKDAAVRDLARAGLVELQQQDRAYAAALRYADRVTEKAEKDEEKAIAGYIRGDVAWQQGRLGDMVHEYQQAMQYSADFPEPEERAHLRIINYLYVVRKDYSEALQRIAEVLLRYPNNRYSYYARYLEGLCHEALGEYQKAADSFAQVVLSYPGSRFTDRRLLRDALYKLPAALQQCQEYDRAVQEYISALEKAPDDLRAPAARLHLAECHRRAGDLDRAVGVYNIFLDSFPDDPHVPNARLALADCYLDYFDFDDARGQLRQLAAKAIGSETEALALGRIAETYVAEADTAPATEARALRAEAESAYRVMIQKFPQSRLAYTRLADLAEKRREWGEAYQNLAAYVEATSEEATDPALSLRLGELASRRGQSGDVLDRLPEAAPSSLEGRAQARWNFYRAEALRKLGRLEEAAAAYQLAKNTATPQSLLADEIERKLRDMQYRQRLAGFAATP